MRLRCGYWRPACRGRWSLVQYALFRDRDPLAIGVLPTGPVLGADGHFELVVKVDGHVPFPLSCFERGARNPLLEAADLRFRNIQVTLAPTYTKHNEHM